MGRIFKEENAPNKTLAFFIYITAEYFFGWLRKADKIRSGWTDNEMKLVNGWNNVKCVSLKYINR